MTIPEIYTKFDIGDSVQRTDDHTIRGVVKSIRINVTDDEPEPPQIIYTITKTRYGENFEVLLPEDQLELDTILMRYSTKELEQELAVRKEIERLSAKNQY